MKTTKISNLFQVNLANSIKAKGLGYKDLAVKIGVSESSIANWINGRGTPKLEDLINIVDVLEIKDLNWLIYGENISDATIKDKCRECEKLKEEVIDLRGQVKVFEKIVDKLTSQNNRERQRGQTGEDDDEQERGQAAAPL